MPRWAVGTPRTPSLGGLLEGLRGILRRVTRAAGILFRRRGPRRIEEGRIPRTMQPGPAARSAPPAFDPNAAAGPESGIFGLPDDAKNAAVHVLGVPFDATTSFRKGTARGPAAILAASRQVDLYDHWNGRPY